MILAARIIPNTEVNDEEENVNPDIPDDSTVIR